MKTNYKLILPLMAILLAISSCKNNDENDPCILTASLTLDFDFVYFLTATGDDGLEPYTYQWSHAGAAGQAVPVSSSGVYSVTITDALGCTATASYTYSTACGLQNTVTDNFGTEYKINSQNRFDQSF